jgi:predicted metal-dependent phosphoesterase TrpH
MTGALNGRADLHMHTIVSDGTATVQETLDHIARMGTLDVIAITDHDRLEASLWAYQHRQRYPFEIVPGVEVTSADGHVLALWVTEPIPAGLSLAETAHAIHEQDGIAVLAHPFEPLIAPHTFWRYLTRPQVLWESGIDAVEVHNAGAFTPGGNWLARRVYRDSGLPLLGNSDAHMPALIGTGVTRFAGRGPGSWTPVCWAGQGFPTCRL